MKPINSYLVIKTSTEIREHADNNYLQGTIASKINGTRKGVRLSEILQHPSNEI